MNTKKAIALLLVLVTALVVCVACANNNGEGGAVTYRIKNNTLANFAIVILREKNDKPQTWTITNMIPQQEGEFTIYTNLKDGAPNLEMKVTNQAGVEFSMDLNQKGNKLITINPDADKPLDKLTAQVEDLK